ncbi:LytR/AlgR family response regulator transcription factor [Thermophagus sp. OGC60D27]|uniref:LytR/AlgR family response regulator transcription factor n=1 Tax=Thermophagus sp. OGC60D27 TaxID=3458415 RepID=UPI0040383327
MVKLRCIITDDEPMARKGLQGYIEKLGFLELVAVCEDAIQLGNVLKAQPVDLIYLDIEMPYLSGVDFLSGLTDSPRIIIVSAYEQYALKGYEFDVADYLLKPVSFERFLKATNKVYDWVQKDKSANSLSESIFIKTTNKYEKVNLADILFIEGMDNYIAIQTTQKKHITHSTLSAFAQKLPPHHFLKIHKSFIVNLDKATSLEGNILGIDHYKLPVSRNYRMEVKKRLLK